MIIRHALKPGDAEAIASLWSALGWGPRDGTDPGDVLAALSGSAWFALAEVDGQAAGYARALSDRIVATYLVEVAVAANCRRRGIGSALIRSCLGAFPRTAVYADATPDAVPLLMRHGVRPRPERLVACARGAQR